MAREAIYKANGNKSDVACVGRKFEVLHVDLATMKFSCKETRRNATNWCLKRLCDFRSWVVAGQVEKARQQYEGCFGDEALVSRAH